MSFSKSKKIQNASVLDLRNVSTTLDELPVLKSVSFTVRKGEFVTILGPSGCGKSTLLHIVGGLKDPTSGTVLLEGKKVSRIGKFGYMPQSSTLLPWRTVRKNVAVGLEIKHFSVRESSEKATEMLRAFDLEQFAEYYPAALSGGMRQQVALLRTILFNNAFLLLDEPFGSLDALTRFSLQLWLLRMRKKYESTVLFVTHDIREAIFLSDRILVMSHRPGTIIADITVQHDGPRDYSWLKTARARQLEEKLLTYFFKQDSELYASE